MEEAFSAARANHTHQNVWWAKYARWLIIHKPKTLLALPLADLAIVKQKLGRHRALTALLHYGDDWTNLPQLKDLFEWTAQDFHDALNDGRNIRLKTHRDAELLTQLSDAELEDNPLTWLAWIAVHVPAPPALVIAKLFACFPPASEFYNSEFYSVFVERLERLVIQKNRNIAEIVVCMRAK
jgi:hypothetical protein